MPINLEEDAGGARSERIPDGECDVLVTRVMCSKQGGAPFKTKGGDRKIVVVLGDDEGREAIFDAILQGKAVWTIARLLKLAGYSTESLAQDGIEDYLDLKDQGTAERMLIGKELRIRVTTSEPNDQGKTYARVELLEQPKKAEPFKPYDPKDPEDIPFDFRPTTR